MIALTAPQRRSKQKEGTAWTINGHQSKIQFDCNLDGTPGGNGIVKENNFGKYRDASIHPEHRCSSSPGSTTQHWFRAVRNF